MFAGYLKKLLCFSAVIGAFAFVLALIVPKNYITPALPYLVLFFIAASILSFHYLLNATGKKFIRFVNAFLITIILKLFVYAVIMIGYVFVNRADAVPFLLSFFALYLLFTIFETVAIVKINRTGKETE